MLVAIVSQNDLVFVFVGGIAQLSRDMLQNGVSYVCACVKLNTRGVRKFWGTGLFPEKVLRNMVYRSDSLIIWRDLGPLSSCVVPHRLDRMSAGQTGHFHGTNRTRPRDGCDPEEESSLCFLVFSSQMKREAEAYRR